MDDAGDAAPDYHDGHRRERHGIQHRPVQPFRLRLRSLPGVLPRRMDVSQRPCVQGQFRHLLHGSECDPAGHCLFLEQKEDRAGNRHQYFSGRLYLGFLRMADEQDLS